MRYGHGNVAILFEGLIFDPYHDRMIEDKGGMIVVSIMYGAFQKFYSALSNLRKFDKEKDFFNNISCLDNFFSEFRSITFVLQKSIAHTEYKNLYEKYREKYLSDSKWFVEKRNQTIKEEPFPLIKQIDISVYFANAGICVDSRKFSVENDVQLTTLMRDLEDFFSQLDPVQIFFSARFTFYERDGEENILLKIANGVDVMYDFLMDMYLATEEKCDLCDALIQKIKSSKSYFDAGDIAFINDYVYYPQTKQFDKAQTFAMYVGDRPLLRSSLAGFDIVRIPNSEGDYFKKFVFLNAIQQSTELMPTLMTVYNDQTFSLDSFTADIKTIFYRKLNETAQRILKEDIKEVYFMMVYISMSAKYLDKPSVERMAHKEEEFLTFMKVDCDLNEEEYVFDGKLLSKEQYVAQTILHGKKSKLEFGINNMRPIIEAFRLKKQMG